ncbi:MAG: 50S ribosomal protein L21 [Blastocatellia bacterium]
MAYAIIRSGGKQFRVSPGDVVRLPSIAGKNAGDAVEFDVLTAGGDNGLRIGSPLVDGASVTGTVVKHGRAPKIIVFKFKKRKGYKKTKGHRQGFTEIKIDTIGDREAKRDQGVVNAEAHETAAETDSEN